MHPASAGMVDIREVVEADLDSVRETVFAALRLDTAEAAVLVDHLWSPPAHRVWTAFVSADGYGAAFASTQQLVRPDSTATGVDEAPHPDNSVRTRGYIDLLAVHPASQRRGLGRALVGAAEAWLAARGATEVRLAGHPPCYAWPGIDVRYTPALCLVERLGYERYDIAWNMTADLSTDLSTRTDVERLAQAGIEVRPADHGERDHVIEFARRHWNDSWAWEVEHATGCHYAVQSGEVLGFAVWGARPTWFGPMGSAPAAEGLGIGRVLLRRCLADQRDAGQATAQIGWVGPLRFYSQAVGARVERVFALYRRHL